ncbi:hypothetical protein DFH11DRAFT_1509569 [Phellopilus nigrolimitatus]|nr:hypothetical protein DFH11DRAFT_1509569 [Phellopilus nigrolimitatus]
MGRYNRAGKPKPFIRVCRTLKLEIFCAWLCYEDITGYAPPNLNWGPLLPPTPLPRPYRIGASLLHGAAIGVIATRDLAFGETIIIERPLLMIPRAVLLPVAANKIQSELEHQLEVMLSQLDEKSRARVNILSNCKTAKDGSKLWGIITTNGLKCNFPQSRYLPHYAGVFPDISRINHSCSPNAVWSFDSRALWAEIRATRPIATGEEITIAYVTPTETRAERQQTLKKKYGFTCHCTQCVATAGRAAAAASNARRKQIDETDRDARETWAAWLRAPASARSDSVIAPHEAVLPLLDIEGLEGGRGWHVAWIALAYAALGDEANFRRWAEEAEKLARVLEQGVGGYGYQTGEEWQKALKNPHALSIWGKRRVNG